VHEQSTGTAAARVGDDVSGHPDAAAPLSIRPATADDAEAVAELLNEVIRSGRYSLLDTPFSVEAERAFIARFPARGVIHVACLPEAGIIGVQSLGPFGQYATHEHDHVCSMGTWVREAYRRRGVGASLAAASFAAARRTGFEKVFTDVRADNQGWLAFHAGLGFTVVGVARRHAKVGGHHVDVVFIEKVL
jgi:L-amino acid N-acyltransferase YncA